MALLSCRPCGLARKPAILQAQSASEWGRPRHSRHTRSRFELVCMCENPLQRFPRCVDDNARWQGVFNDGTLGKSYVFHLIVAMAVILLSSAVVFGQAHDHLTAGIRSGEASYSTYARTGGKLGSIRGRRRMAFQDPQGRSVPRWARAHRSGRCQFDQLPPWRRLDLGGSAARRAGTGYHYRGRRHRCLQTERWQCRLPIPSH